MAIKKEEIKKPDFIKWFSESNKDGGSIVGGKGANLSEIYNLKIPVPPGFVVTAQAYQYFIEKAKIKEKIKELLDRINYEDTKELNEITTNIRALITDSKMPPEIQEEIIESYENLDTQGFDVEKGSPLEIINTTSEPMFVAVRSSATTEDLAKASFAGQQDTYLNIKGKQELIKHIKKCFASLFTARATYYRNKKKFEHEKASLAVIVQKMVDSTKSGVMFSKDPSYKNDNIIIEAVWGLGEGIVSGKITPDKYVITPDLEILDKKIADKKIAITRDSAGNQTIIKLREEKSNHQVLKDTEIRKLTEFAKELEEHYKKPQDIEFAIENNEMFIVQTRPITTIEKRIDKTEHTEINAEPILEGLAASPGIASGKIKIIEDLEDLHKIKTGDILVTKMTNPDMVVSMQKSTAIITDEGGLTAHAAIVSREMGIPCIVGTKTATTKLKDGEIITVDGYSGKIYRGKVAETEKKEVLPVTAKTKIKIKVIVDLPTFAERASKTNLTQVGLTRIEGIIAESGKHPNYFLEQNKIKEYEELVFKGVEGIAKYFEEIWVRTSDIRSDEFANLEGAPQEKEANPMLGMHGIRYGIKNPDILKAELTALKRIAEQNKKVGLLLPQIISIEEVQFVKKIAEEIDFTDAKFGVMVETPAAVQLIKDLCEEGIEFISFGTNDLTQYILAVDRGNEQVQHLYNEMHPAVLYQIAFVIRVCKRYNVETSLCGQAGSRKEMVKFLVENKIDSISVNADTAKEISDYVYKLENNTTKETEEEEESETAEIPREESGEPEPKESSEETTEEEEPKTSEEDSNEPEDKQIDESSKEKIEQDIEQIEKEKQEYLENNPEKEKETTEENPEENKELDIY